RVETLHNANDDGVLKIALLLAAVGRRRADRFMLAMLAGHGEKLRIPETQDEWSVRLDKANSVCNFLRVRKLHELVEGLIKAFEEYSTDDCHPYFEHKSKLVQLRDELRFKHTHFLGFRRQPYAYTYQVYGIAASVRQYRDAVLPELHSWAVSLRELVLVFDDVGKYSRSITLGIVKRFPPGSPKRYEVIIRLDQEHR
ncbi:hypothetical protein THAOC_29506, partial [Thalassiosira oceanica]